MPAADSPPHTSPPHVASDTGRAGAAPRSPIALLATVVVLAMSTWFSITPVATSFAAATSLNQATFRLATVAVPLGFVAGALGSALANLADRRPPGHLLFAGALGAAIANAVPLAVTTPLGAMTSRFAVGASLALVLPVALKTTSTWTVHGRGTAIGTVLAGLCTGTAAPHLIAVAELPWRPAIVTTSVLASLAALIARATICDGPHPYSIPPFDARHVLRPMRNRLVRRAYAGYFGHMWELYAAWAWLGAYLDHELGPGWLAPTVTAVAIASGGIGAVRQGVAGDRLGHAHVARRALLWSGLSVTLLALGPWRSPASTIALAAAWGYWVIADSAQFTVLVTRHADRDIVGTAVTLQLAIGFSLTTATLWLVPAVRDLAGWSWALLLLAPGPLLGRLAMAPLVRPEARPS